MYVSLTGPGGNIGDALIRRSGLDWVRNISGELVTYTGATPDVWLRQLGVPGDAIVLRSKRSVPKWLWMLLTASKHPVLVFEAGEVPLGRGNGLRELVFLAETIIVRFKGGVVVRPPRGIRGRSQPSLWLHTRAVRLSQIALWRDARSAAAVGGRRVVPDIGFGAGIRPGRPWSDRKELIVSLRGLREMPDGQWVEAVRATADRESLRIRTLVQVREDESRAAELAEALGGTFEPWGDTDPVEQEALLRERYDGAKLVISDRMHVLVLAALSGAVPVEVVPNPTGKITDAFATVGLHGITRDAASAGAEEMQEFLRDQLQRVPEVVERVREADQRLRAIEAEVRQTIEAARR